MKKDIHPKYGPAKITCACGTEFEVGSTKPAIQVEICSACHPFYTGTQKLVDTAGRVDKYQERMDKTKALREAAKKRVTTVKKEKKSSSKAKSKETAKKLAELKSAINKPGKKNKKEK